MQQATHTPNGYDPRWIKAINTVLDDRETGLRITDLTPEFWDNYIGPMIDDIEKRDALLEVQEQQTCARCDKTIAIGKDESTPSGSMHPRCARAYERESPQDW